MHLALHISWNLLPTFPFVPSEIMPMHAYKDKNLMVSWPSSHSPQYYSVFIKVLVLVYNLRTDMLI